MCEKRVSERLPKLPMCRRIDMARMCRERERLQKKNDGPKKGGIHTFSICISIRWYTSTWDKVPCYDCKWHDKKNKIARNPWYNIYSRECRRWNTNKTQEWHTHDRKKTTKTESADCLMVYLSCWMGFFSHSSLSMACLASSSRVSTFSVWFVISYAQRFLRPTHFTLDFFPFGCVCVCVCVL